MDGNSGDEENGELIIIIIIIIIMHEYDYDFLQKVSTNHFYVMRTKSYRIRWNNANLGAHAVHDHSRSPIFVPIESSYATAY